MDSGFKRGQSDNLPQVDMSMVFDFLSNNPLFTSAEIRGVKLAICGTGGLATYNTLHQLPCYYNKSHGILAEGFVRILLEAGHEVTCVTPYPKKSQPYLRYIDVSKTIALRLTPNPFANLTAIINKETDTSVLSMVKILKSMLKNFADLANATYSSEQMKKLMNDPNEKFDLIIIEWLFNDMHAGLSDIFDCPYIWFSSVSPHWVVLRLIDESLNPAFNQDMMSSNLPPLNFVQRIQELFSQIFWSLLRIILIESTERQQYNQIFGPIMAKKGRSLTPYDEIKYKASFMFGNSHVSTGRPMSLPENYKHIGGYHINPEVKRLPEDLRRIMNTAKNGVIYFSLGSIVKSNELPDVIKQSLLKMFGSLKYTVIWKFEEKLSGLPKNVHILQWAPQPSILAHPNCKLFITHGGLLSTIETVHFGIPIIGIPVFADQFINVEIAKKKGFALRVDLSYEMAEDLKVAIEEILGNPKYREKIEELSFIFHDRPVTPAAELAHWVDHVIHSKGAPHLRSIALMVPWYQKFYLDFMALVLLVLFVTVKVVKLCCTRKRTTNTKKNN